MRNLQAEMARYGISVVDIAKLLGCTEKTIRSKLAETTDFTYPEARLIHVKLFSTLQMEYLFASDKDKVA